ncbi:MAG: ferrous iron transporter B [Deltaproteobacteria bacterium]|nr:ferrous iron transporter B [Deltaproteobacteria bacterium]
MHAFTAKPGSGINIVFGNRKTASASRLPAVAIVGNMNVGKTTLIERMCGVDAISANVPGSTVFNSRYRTKLKGIEVIDTPGTNSVLSNNEDERVSRDILLSLAKEQKVAGAVFVADAKNLKRSIALILEYAEYGIPMLLDINMADELASRGITIDYQKLSDLLALDVYETVATEGLGVEKIEAKLNRLRVPKHLMKYPDSIEQYTETVRNILAHNPGRIALRGLALLLLAGDKSIEAYVAEVYGDSILNQLKSLAEQYREGEPGAFILRLTSLYNKKAQEIVDEVQKTGPALKSPFIERFGEWCTRLNTGIPIAVAVIVLMYLFVGSFGATFLVDNINTHFFEALLVPFFEKLVEPLPSAFLRDMIVDPDFGLLPTGVFLALGLVLPVLFCFYIFFGFLEDSGYLPRVSFLLDRVFKIIGLNGKGVMPLTMGFSCVTMAILTTRMLDTPKERNIATFLLVLGFPCAPLLAVMLVVLDQMPVTATLTIFGLLFVQILLAGFIAAKIIPGRSSPLLMEIPTMRIPHPLNIVKKSYYRTYSFMKEAVPVFILASVVVFLFDRLGGLRALEELLKPLTNGFLGLPERSVQVFIKTLIRRESGATELMHLSNTYSHLQLIVNLFVMVNLTPCMNSILVIFKERGFKAASAIIGSVLVYAIIAGGVLNHVCLLLGVTFI